MDFLVYVIEALLVATFILVAITGVLIAWIVLMLEIRFVFGGSSDADW